MAKITGRRTTPLSFGWIVFGCIPCSMPFVLLGLLAFLSLASKDYLLVLILVLLCIPAWRSKDLREYRQEIGAWRKHRTSIRLTRKIKRVVWQLRDDSYDLRDPNEIQVCIRREKDKVLGKTIHIVIGMAGYFAGPQTILQYISPTMERGCFETATIDQLEDVLTAVLTVREHCG